MFKQFFQKFKRHDFDIQNPWRRGARIFDSKDKSPNIYKCRKCGELIEKEDLWDMLTLSYKESHGCKR